LNVTTCVGVRHLSRVQSELHLIFVSLPCLGALKHPRTPPPNLSVDYPSGDSDHVAKRTRPMGITDEVNLNLLVDRTLELTPTIMQVLTLDPSSFPDIYHFM
jgi:hypothetical protein